MSNQEELVNGQEELLVFNGINAQTGQYLFPPMKPKEIVALAKEIEEDGKHLEALKKRAESEEDKDWGTVFRVKDPGDLAQAGWGVIFAQDEETPALEDALHELLEYRKEQAKAKKETYYQEYAYEGGSAIEFLADYLVDPYALADPEQMPYYLLIVGDPTKIPYSFQYQLDVQRAVGRIHFTKPDGSANLQEYAQYAHNVVQAERGELELPRQATFFGVRNRNDKATRLSASHLVLPLADDLDEYQKEQQLGWNIRKLLEKGADKEQLGRLLGGSETPALLFTASHGAGFPGNPERQLRHQGALVCQNWPGPVLWKDKPLLEEHYFSAADVSASAQLLGTLTFHFACYGAGTPELNDFTHHRSFKEPVGIAPHAFVARLPQKLLTRGALAVVGHVERAWSYSFRWAHDDHIVAFRDAFDHLMAGDPVGRAMESFNSRYATLSTSLTRTIDTKIKKNKSVNPGDFSREWTANNDARSYVIVGDPAVRLHLRADDDAAVEPVRPVIQVVTHSAERNSDTGSDVSPEMEVEAAAEAEGEVEYRILGRRKERKPREESEEERGLRQSLKQLTDKLGQAIAHFAQDVTTLEVKTYYDSDVEGIEFKNGKFVGEAQPTPRASTYIKLDGDMTVIVPRGDDELWAIHREMVQLAQENRAKLIEITISAATSMVNILG